MKKRGNVSENLLNKRFGRLIPIEIAEKRGKSSSTFWKCLCECGNTHIASAQHLKLGQVTKCRKCPAKSESQLLEEAKVRFFSNIEKQEDCWIWKGSKIKGYGVLFFKKNIKSHRFSYMIHKGILRKGLVICHTCDNPSCVNPDHLVQSSSRKNTIDASFKGNLRRGESHHKSKLTENDVKEILFGSEKGVTLAQKFNVNKNTISRIRRGRQWQHLS